MLVDISIAGRPGEQLLHPLDLRQIFRQMGLHRKTIFLLQLTQPFQQGSAACRRKPGGKDGTGIGIFSGGLTKPCGGAFQGFPGIRFPQVVGTVLIHIDLAHISGQAGSIQLLHQKFRGRKMDGAENHSSCGPAFFQIFDKNPISFFGIFQIRVPALLRKGMGIQPFQQFQIHPDAPERVLGGVDMQIGHAGNDESVSIVLHRQIPIFVRDHRINAPGNSFAADQIALLSHRQAVLRL